MLVLLGVFLIIGVSVFLYSKSYILKGVKMSLKSRRIGPAIDEMSGFDNRVVHPGKSLPWEQLESPRNLTAESIHKLEKIDSTAFLVIKDEKIYCEKYWEPCSRSSVSNSFSVAKSVVSTLIGVAMKENLLKISDPVSKHLKSFETDGKENITIEHLLQMSSGLKWTESEGSALSHNAEAYYGDDLQTMINKIRLRRPPGQDYRYASGNTQILAMVLAEVTGMTLSEYASQKLWKVLGAEYPAYWNLDRKEGMEKAFCCLYAAPSDLARLGQLYLNHGSWNGEEVLSASFIEKSLMPTHLQDVLLRKPNDIYGMHWWLVSHRGYDFFYARGIRGQYIICNQQLNLVIVRMGHKRNPVDHRNGHPPDLFDHINAGLEIIISGPAIAP